MSAATDGEARFWKLVAPLLEQRDVSRSTMMGLPCLRVHGAFFASYDRRNGDLFVKLPAGRVDALVTEGHAHLYAPARRRFREWAAVPPTRSSSWPHRLDEALAFVDGAC